MPIYSTDGAYISYAIGTDLTAWRHADAALTAALVQATDKIDAHQNIAVDYTDPDVEETGHLSSSQYKVRHTAGYKTGKIVLPMFLQTGVPLYATLGTCTTSRTGKETTTVVCLAGDAMVDGSYFLINCINAAGATVKNYVWFNMGGDADPAPAGYTELQVDYLVGDTAAQVAAKLNAVMDVADFYDSTVATATVTIVTANNGAVEDATDFDSTLVITVTVQGACTHAISLASSQTPISYAIHFEKELDSEDDRYDFLGFMPDNWNLSCGDDKARWKARQLFSANFAYSRAAGGDLAEPTKDPAPIFEWNDLKHASGVLTVKYNGTDLDFTIRAIDLFIPRTMPLWGVKDGNYPSEAFIAGMAPELLLEGNLTGKNVRSLMATKPEDYAGTGLDIEIKFYKDATNEFGISLGNFYLVPDETVMNEVDWYERKTLRFVPIGTTTTVSASVEDRKNKTYYEND